MLKVPDVANNTPDVIPLDTFTFVEVIFVTVALDIVALRIFALPDVKLSVDTFCDVTFVLTSVPMLPVVTTALVEVTLVAMTFAELSKVVTRIVPDVIPVDVRLDAVTFVTVKLDTVAPFTAILAAVTLVANNVPVDKPVDKTSPFPVAVVNCI